jgi:glutathione S-transferase/RNA polymerase-associated protein
MPHLLDIPLSPYAQKIKLALMEKGIAFETSIPNVDAPDAAFVAVSPRLEVPALIDGDVKLFDSTIILQYVEERWPEPPLLPESAAERARVRMLEEVCDTLYDAVTWGVAEVTVFKRAEGEAAERMLAKAREQIAGLNAFLERGLAGREFFNGERFGYGDVAVYPFVNGAAAVGYKPAPDGALDRWLRATRKRASAERCKADVVSTLASFMNRPRDIAEGRAKREYRDHRLDWMLRSGGVQAVLDGMAKGTIRFSREIE